MTCSIVIIEMAGAKGKNKNVNLNLNEELRLKLSPSNHSAPVRLIELVNLKLKFQFLIRFD